MEEINDKLLQFFTKHYKPGIIGIVGTKGTIGSAIREAQKAVTKDKKASLWSHCFIFGELRFGRTGQNREKRPYIFESDLHMDLFKPQLRNGAQENWIGKWCREEVENAAVIDFGLSEDQRDNILATALQSIIDQEFYPIQKLLSAWLRIITEKQWLPDPVDDPHAMHCSAFVRYCYKEGKRDFIGPGVSVSNTTPEDIAQAGIKEGQITIFNK